MEGGEAIVQITPSETAAHTMSVVEVGPGEAIQGDTAGVVPVTTTAAESGAATDGMQGEATSTDSAGNTTSSITDQAPEATVTVSTWSTDGEIGTGNDASSVTAAVITLPADTVAGSSPAVPTSLPLTTVTVSSTNRRPSASSPGKPSFRQWTFEEQFKQVNSCLSSRAHRPSVFYRLV